MNILKMMRKKLKNFSFKKFVAIFTTTCFIFSIICSQTIYAAMPISNSAAPIDLNNMPNSIIPFNLGRITDAYYSNNSGDVVINIQDLHSHEQTQRNISSILSILDNKFGIVDIYVEGATGILNTSWLSDIKDSKTKQQVLDNLLRNGRLSGGEFFAVQSNKKTILKGLEDNKLYSQNFNKLNEIYNKKYEITNYLSIIKNIFNKNSEQYYSKENKKINKIVESYKEGKIKTDKYIELLLQKAQITNINLSKYKNIINFTRIISGQKSFNQKGLTNEIKEILKELKEKINYSEYKSLIEKASKKEQEIEFYFSLLTKDSQFNILSNKRYKNTKLFFEYLKQNQNINTIDLANEEKAFVQELQNKLATTQTEKEILFLQYNIESLSHYLTNKMTAKEYVDFSQNKDEFKLLWKKYIDIDNLIDLTEYFDLVDTFYKNNLERNRISIKKLLGKNIDKQNNGLRIKNALINHENKIVEQLTNGKKIHVVITGGFHTYDFNKLLEDENANYIVITPNISEETKKAEILYENIFNEQYDITNTTFANRPISEVISLLNKGEIKEVRPVGKDVEIEYVSGEIYSLKEIQQEQEISVKILSKEQAVLAADIITDIQRIKQLKRENSRADKENLSITPTQDLEKRLKDNLTKITDLNLRKVLEEKVKAEVPNQELTKNSIKNQIWYKTLTRLGWITLRESLVAVLEQKDFNNIFTEEILGKIFDKQESAREKFLKEHYQGEDEDKAIQIHEQLNVAITSIIDAMDNTYKIVFGFSRIHFIAQLAAKITGVQKHKKYNVNIYKLTKNSDLLLTKNQQHTYQIKFTVFFKLNGMLIEYKTGDNFFTTAPTKEKALNNAVRRMAEEILDKYKLDKRQLINLTMYLIRQNLKEKYSNINKNIIEVEEEAEEKSEKEETKKITEKEQTILSRTTNKTFTMRQPKSGEYKFNIVIPGLNDSPDLATFQTVYARSPRQAIFELVYQICMATKDGYLTDGIFEGLTISQENIDKIADILSQRYKEKKIEEIVKKIKPNNAPVLNDNVTPKQQSRQLKLGETVYRVIIPNFNDREGLEPYQYVIAVDEDKAIEEAILAIIKARERGEIRGGYYNYIAISDTRNREGKKNKDIILEAIKKSNTAKIENLSESPEEKTIEFDKEKQKIQQEPQTNLQKLISELTNSKNVIELKTAIELMLNAGFKEDYIEKLLYQYLTLRNGNIPQEVYSKTAPIKFGTAGVRGIMGEEVDFLDIIIITQAISNVISAIANKQNINTKDIKILVGGDSRFLSKQFAEIVSKILAANDINVVISRDDIPSPAISYYTRANGFTLSINITASHNPKEHNGYKITLGDGGQAGTDVTAMIENKIKSLQDKLTSNINPIKVVKDSPKITHVDVKPNFIKDFIEMIRKMFAIDNDSAFSKFKEKAAQWTVVVDPKNGATKTYYYEILKFFGFNVVMINDSIDPTFGGQKPEPSFANTEQLRKKVPAVKQTAQGQNILGISTDVDGDRFAVVDENGNFITANDIGTILLNFRLKTLLDDLLSEIMAANGDIEKQNAILKNFVTKKDKKTGEEKDWKIIVPRNCATTHVLDDLAEKLVSQCYDKLKELNLDPQLLNKFKNTVEVKEVNVGFKFFAQAKHNAEDNGDLFLLGVESSGGISVAEWIYDKCGFLANLMLLFVLVGENKQPGEILNDIYSKISYEPQGLETAIRFREIVEKEGKLNTPEKISAEAKSRQEQLMATLGKLKQNENNEDIKNLFTDIDAGLKIKEIRTNDGIKIIFENGTWLLIRPSGTEPIVRIFDETKGNKALSQKLADFVMENGGKNLTNKIEQILEPKSESLQTNVEILKGIIINAVESLQRLTYSVLFKDNMEYTIVADVSDLARIKKAEVLSKSGIKVNLILTGDTSLIRETDSRLSTPNGQLAFCLIETPNSNLTVYGYDDKLSDEQLLNSQKISEQDALIAMLNHITNQSKMSIKILDLPNTSNKNIVISDIEEISQGKFTVTGVGKTALNLFTDALKNKKTDDMFIKPSLVASNLSDEQIDNFGQQDINRLIEQGVTTIIISADDKLLQNKSQTLKNLLQIAHDNGLKVMFNYSFNLKERSINDFEKWILKFNDNFRQFKENGGIDGLQLDLSQNGVLANNSNVLSLLSKLSKIINEQNVGSFLSIKMPSDIYPTEFLILCNNEGIKLVADYDSPLVSIGLSNLKAENMIINISADKNGNISIQKLANLFENNKVSMISFDLPILESIDTANGFSFKGMSLTKFISSIFETTPEGQNIKGINKGRNFVIDRDFIIDEDTLSTLYSMYITDKFDIVQINMLLKTNFNENISKYEIKGFIKGLLESTELKRLNAIDISFDKKDYTNLLMQTLLDYRINEGISFNKDLPSDIEKILAVDNFSEEFKPKIEEIYNILNGRFEDKIDTVINILASLKENLQLTSQERTMVLEGLLLLLLGYAKQDIIDMGNLTDDNSIANIKALLRAA